MYRILFGLVLALCLSKTVQSQPAFEGNFPENQPLQEYFAAEDGNYNKSIIYIFFNNDPCYECPQTIALIEQIYNQYYADRYSMFVINYAEDNEYNFADAYDLQAPLNVVLVRVADGESLGYRKLSNPQNQIEATEDFTNYLTEQINEFLGDE